MHSLNPHRNNCLHDAAEAYILERLPAAELDEFEEHLLICSDCQERVRESDQFVRSIRAAFSAETHTHRSPARRRTLRMGRACGAFGQL